MIGLFDEESGSLQGGCTLIELDQKSAAEIEMIAVKESCRNRGYGRALIKHIISEHYNKCYSKLYVRCHDKQSYKFFEHQGFKRVILKADGENSPDS